jgi:uncharacterized SAM-binding protein YcdF (DUF218 family)
MQTGLQSTGSRFLEHGRRGLRRVAVLCTAALLAGVFGGFGVFVLMIERREQALLPQAEAVIALTGGVDRIADALEHLDAGRANRLLITGVHAGTSAQKIAELQPAAKKHLACCIDIGHKALNTVGNADEAARWMEGHRFTSALVVTSSYHMPRTMLELGRRMPNVRLHPAPVVSDRLKVSRLWDDPGLVKILALEYGKFIVASLRAGLTQPALPEDTASLRSRRGS